jgi:hypothetical protein
LAWACRDLLTLGGAYSTTKSVLGAFATQAATRSPSITTSHTPH